MAWQILFLLFTLALMVAFSTGAPIAFAFLAVNAVTAMLLAGVQTGGLQIAQSLDLIMSYSLLPIPLFVLMGELLFHSGMATRTLDGIGKWFGRVPGRLALLTTAGGAAVGMFSGSAVASTTMLGTLLVPEMRAKGYNNRLAVGAVLGAGGLAMVIPPSSLAVLVGTIGQISIGRLLVAGFIPGMMLAVCAMAYILIRCKLRPGDAPAYDVERFGWRERWRSLFVDVLPLGSVMIVILGLIIMGWATPTEAAAVGVVVAFALIGSYGLLSRRALVGASFGTLKITAGILLIIAAAAGYSQVMAYSGAIRGVIETVTALALDPMLIVVLMLLVILIIGGPLEDISLMLICLPVFVPIVVELGFDPVWFGLIFLLMLDVANLSPPVGLSLFIMQQVTHDDVTTNDIYWAAIPFLIIDLFVIALILAWPGLALWLPELLFR